MLILVLEASTSSAKAMLYDTDSNTYKVETKPYVGSYGDVIEQNPEDVFNQMIKLGKELAKDKKIEVVSLSGTWHSVLLCDTNMVPKTPAYPWTNTMATDVCKELRKDTDYVNSFYQRTGCMVNAIYPPFKLKYLQEQGYDLSKYYIMSQGTYNNYRLTGQRVTTRCLESGNALLNIHKKEYDIELLAELGVEESQMPRLLEYNTMLPLTKEGAELLGIEEGTPVIPTNADGGLNQVGAGALKEGVMTFSVGTSGAIRLTTEKPLIPQKPSTWCYLSPKAWLSGAATSGCCNCIDWAKESFFGSHISYLEIEEGIKDKTTTPIFLPFLFGERCPGWNDEKRGGFVKLKPSHKRNDLYRAVQEGVLFNLYHCYQTLVKINGIPKKIKLSGGVLRSKDWTQMCADIFGVNMDIDKSEHASLLGGAVLAMELMGVILDLRDFQVESVAVIRPNPKMAEVYKEKFNRYLMCYEKLNE